MTRKAYCDYNIQSDFKIAFPSANNYATSQWNYLVIHNIVTYTLTIQWSHQMTVTSESQVNFYATSSGETLQSNNYREHFCNSVESRNDVYLSVIINRMQIYHFVSSYWLLPLWSFVTWKKCHIDWLCCRVSTYFPQPIFISLYFEFSQVTKLPFCVSF